MDAWQFSRLRSGQLGKAAGQDNPGLRVRTVQVAGKLTGLASGHLGHGTGIEDDEVRLGWIRDDLAAICRQVSRQSLNFVLVKLAA